MTKHLEAGPRRLTLLPLVAACFFIVSGGPYGLEELVAKSGYDRAFWILILTPLVWSLPTAFAVVELAAALPERGGYYAWVRRALGPFWGFQEAWLSLAASFFDMAIYPTLFLLYLKQVLPAAERPAVGLALGIAFIGAGALLNITGARSVGRSSELFALAILGPFAVLVGVAAVHPAAPVRPIVPGGLMAGVLVAMWNYMGWDNACNFANEVDRPQRTYPRAIFGTVALVTLTYLLPVLAAQRAGLDPSGWSAGSWATAASAIAGRWLGTAVVAGGMVCAFGMYNSLVLSYSRLPVALAEDGFLPAAFGKLHPRTQAPWLAIGACALCYAACLGLDFDRLLLLDILLYGLSLLLEFVALIVLRIREPNLARPFRVPGGLTGAVVIAVPPMVLLAFALAAALADPEASRLAPWIGGGLIALGPILYLAGSAEVRRRARGGPVVSES